jgi:uncharacterized protein (DUF2267 family)
MIQQANRTQPQPRKKRDIHFLDDTLSKTKLWLKEIQKELNLDTQRDAYAALRSVLHALRDRLSTDEAAQLGAQLPTLIRGFYYEGWDPQGRPQKINNAQEFLECIADEIGRGRLSKGPSAIAVTQAVLKVLQTKISSGEIDDVKGSIPQDIVNLWPEEQSVSREQFSRKSAKPQGPYEVNEAALVEESGGQWKEDSKAGKSPKDHPGDVIAWDSPDEGEGTSI